jgi:hypothetical protein
MVFDLLRLIKNCTFAIARVPLIYTAEVRTRVAWIYGSRAAFAELAH